MIQQILEKCLAELSNESPRLDYVRGMLEVLLASQPAGSSNGRTAVFGTASVSPILTPATTDEAAILDAKARASLEAVKKLNLE